MGVNTKRQIQRCTTRRDGGLNERRYLRSYIACTGNVAQEADLADRSAKRGERIDLVDFCAGKPTKWLHERKKYITRSKNRSIMLHHITWQLKRLALLTVNKKILSVLSVDQHQLIHRIRSRKLTYLSTEKLAIIANTCCAIEKALLPGTFIEAGCALGGSAILIAFVKSHHRPCLVYDVFGMIPPPSHLDTNEVHSRYRTIVNGKSKGIRGDKYYGYQENLYEIVQKNLESFGIKCKEQSVSLVKGLIQETMKIDGLVAFAHIDVDWYEPVMICLKRIFPNLVIGGSIIVDDYYDWGGCRKATDEYLREVAGQFVLDGSSGSLTITKVKS